MRALTTRRPRATVLALAAALAATSLTGIGPVAAGPRQAPEGAAGLPVLETPPSSPLAVWPAHAPSGVERFAATTSPDVEAVPATPAGGPQSIIGAPESVIGADGRERLRLDKTSVFPLSAIGQVEFVQDGRTYICTGYLLDGNSVLTAGHCSFDGGEDDPVDSASFFPGRERQNGVVVNPWGGCAVTAVWAPDKWRFDATPAHDYAVMQLDDGCDFSESAGSFGLFTLDGANAFAGRRLRVEGYPGDKSNGSRWKMVGEVDRNSVNFLHYPMDTFGGQSGSPLFKWNRPECGGPCSAGVHAYGASGNPPMNSGPMMTQGRIGTIAAVAQANGG